MMAAFDWLLVHAEQQGASVTVATELDRRTQALSDMSATHAQFNMASPEREETSALWWGFQV